MLFDYPFIMKPADAVTSGLISAVTEPSIPADSQPLVVGL
jgi:ATP-dependent protease ClpP protease subunit